MAEFEEHPSKAAAWRCGEFVVLPDAAAEDCTIWFRLEPDVDSDIRWEGLLGRRLADDRARVCGVPFWVYDLNLGDEVRTMPSAEGALIAMESIHHAGNHTFRVFFNNDEDDDLSWRELQQELEAFDCWFDVRTRRFIAISCPPSHAQVVADYLETRERNGDLHYETGRMRLPDS